MVARSPGYLLIKSPPLHHSLETMSRILPPNFGSTAAGSAYEKLKQDNVIEDMTQVLQPGAEVSLTLELLPICWTGSGVI